MTDSFTFAVLADAHVRPPDERFGPDDYPSNRLFNDRNRHAIRLVNRFAPEFVLHLGDMVHPIPALASYPAAVQAARELYRELAVPLYVTPGNHDLGDKPNAWTPAPTVTGENNDVFEKDWGPVWQTFVHAGCRFVLINSPVLNSGLKREGGQRDWLESELKAWQKAGKRIFLFTHYPLFLNTPDEDEHYDNLGEPARAWLLARLAQFKVEAVFTGHAHSFFYNRYRNTDLYVLPALSFVRPEFSEMFHVEPTAEYGRDDTAKLGFFLVTVDDKSHRIEFVRTDKLGAEPRAIPSALMSRATDRRIAPLGVSLRHAWATIIEMPHDNLDEFTRKRVRNDYPLLALWEMGVSKLRVPLADLAREGTRERIRALRARGHAFVVFSVGIPGEREQGTLLAHHDLFDGWEVIVPTAHIPALLRWLREIKPRLPARVLVSKLETIDDQRKEGAAEFSHFASHGFRLSDREWLAAQDISGAADGWSFRIEPNVKPWAGVLSVCEFAAQQRIRAIAHVNMPRATEGRAGVDDRAGANLVAETCCVALAAAEVHIFLDTFVDHDRGYYPRHGLVDRRFNPRPAAYVLQHLNRLVGDHHDHVKMSRVDALAGVRAFTFESRQRRGLAIVADGESARGEFTLSWAAVPSGKRGSAQWVDLCTGEVHPVQWTRSSSVPEEVSFQIPPTLPCPGVVLFE